jgi:UDP:flavonoid glycosyltransferase YjiC (YdhE family)
VVLKQLEETGAGIGLKMEEITARIRQDMVQKLLSENS